MCTLCGFNLFLAIVTIPQRFQVLNGDTSLLAGIRLLPFLATSAIGSTLFGIISARRNWTFALSLIASSFLLLGSGLLSIKPSPGSITPETYVFQVFYGLGTGGLLSSTAYISGLNSNYEDYGKCRCRDAVLIDAYHVYSLIVRHHQPMPYPRRLHRTGPHHCRSQRDIQQSARDSATTQRTATAAIVVGLHIIPLSRKTSSRCRSLCRRFRATIPNGDLCCSLGVPCKLLVLHETSDCAEEEIASREDDRRWRGGVAGG